MNTPDGGAPERDTCGYDPHGSVSLLVATDGAVWASYDYQPYGLPDEGLSKGGATVPLLNPFRRGGHSCSPIVRTLD